MKCVDYISEFRETIDSIYGTFIDASNGFLFVQQQADKDKAEAILEYENLKTRQPEIAGHHLGGIEISYPRIVRAGCSLHYTHLHCVPVEILKRRNTEGGANFQFIGNMCLVALYQYWDEYYRPAFAKDLGVSKDKIRVSIFADLNQYRRAIIHHRGIATPEIKKCNTFNWFEPGEQILLTKDMFEQIIDAVFAFLDAFQKKPEDYINLITTACN
jgi:hypothetical protein